MCGTADMKDSPMSFKPVAALAVNHVAVGTPAERKFRWYWSLPVHRPRGLPCSSWWVTAMPRHSAIGPSLGSWPRPHSCRARSTTTMLY